MFGYEDRSVLIIHPTNVAGLRLKCGGKMELETKAWDMWLRSYPLSLISWAMHYCSGSFDERVRSLLLV
jgi:hypothetical protein